MIFKRLLSLAICTLIALPPQTFASIGDNGTPSSAPEMDPKHESFINDLENGTIRYSAKDADIFHLTNQTIEIFDKNGTANYNLNDRQVQIPFVAFTGLKISYDAKTQSLFFDAYRGLDSNGENGLMVARQTIRNVDLKASAQDAELFQFVDSNMHLHAIDLGMVAIQLFKSPIPIFQNLWQPDAESLSRWNLGDGAVRSQGQLRAGFLTRGTQPLYLGHAVIAPHDGEGNVRLTAGDFYVAYETGYGKTANAYGVFSREATYANIIRGYKVLQMQTALLSTNTASQLEAESLIEKLQGELDRQELAVMNEKVSPAARIILRSLDKKSIASLKARENAVGALQKNTFDTFTPNEWMATLHEIEKNAGPDVSDQTKQESWFKLINKIQSDNKAAEAKRAPTAKERLANLRRQLATNESYRSIAIVLTAATPYLYSVFAPYLGSFVDSQFEALQQIKVAMWAYENFYPAVLKDASYRIPLILSTVSIIAIWPEAVLLSAMVGKTLRQMAEKVKTQTNRKAIYIKDLAKNWGNINNWQRITSFGMRLYAKLIVPYWRVLVDTIFQQKAFFAATNNDLNPLQKIEVSSEMGQKLGLTEDQTIGLNRVFGPRKKQEIEEKLKIQGLLASENQNFDSIALLVSATLVAEKHKMDPALLLMLGRETGDLDVSRVQAILDSPEKRREWQMLTQMLIKQMSELKRQSIVVDSHMQELITRYYTEGEKIARRLDTMSELKKRILRFRLSVDSQMSDKAKALANFGLEDSAFLSRVYTNEFVAGQVQKEFTVDHVMVATIIAGYGERADLAHPEHLAADPHGFLWTSKAHWYDVFLNTFSHFFIAGAQTALVFQKLRPLVAANYAPIEDYAFVTKERHEGLVSGAKAWMQVLDLSKSDLGGIVTKRFLKRFTTMTAGITLTLILRHAIWGQSLTTAYTAWAFMFFTAQWFYGWIWDPVQRGNEMEGERIDEMNGELKVARQQISRGDFNQGKARLTALYQKYNPKVLKLFDVDKMSKPELLMLSVDQPPVYTHANKWISWVTTWTAAVGSTAMAIPLSVILMDEKLLFAQETWYKWVPISVAAYTACFFLQAKYIEKYKAIYEASKAGWKKRLEPLRQQLAERAAARTEQKVERAQAAAQVAQARSCEALFSPASRFSFRPTFR